jgi:orotidine-5'-phosphate decarboxylase
MNLETLKQNIKAKKSLLCIGLDTDVNKIPATIKSDYKNPVIEFNKRIIDATQEFAVAYKINTAFYESEGLNGWKNLEDTIKLIPNDCFIIADAKRADIGNTSKMYARAFFEQLGADAVTVAPYMGKDSISPFLDYTDKCTILLALTSNKGSIDFQYLNIDKTNKPLYQHVISTSKEWGNEKNMMYVVGATHPDEIEAIRELIPDHFLLVPGVGSQGGDLTAILKNGMNKNYGLLINVSRAIIFASDGSDFESAAYEKALEYRNIMAGFIA